MKFTNPPRGTADSEQSHTLRRLVQEYQGTEKRNQILLQGSRRERHCRRNRIHPVVHKSMETGEIMYFSLSAIKNS